MRCDMMAPVAATIRKSGDGERFILISFLSQQRKTRVGRGGRNFNKPPNVGSRKWTAAPQQKRLHQSCSSHIERSPALSDNENGISRDPGIPNHALSLK